MKERICPICKGIDKQSLFHQSFSGFSTNNLLSSYDVVSCNTCGFCFADNIPEQIDFDKYYKELSKYENFSLELKESPYDRKRFSIMVDYIKRFISHSEDHIVEVGCATGFLLSLIKNEGFLNVTGIDPSPACSKTAQDHYKIKVLTNTISTIDLPKNSVDFLILVGVLEHIKDLDESIQKLRALLRPGGRFFIAIPDGSQYFRGEDAPFQEFSVEHINFFGPVSLENLMKRNGFSKKDISQDMIEVNYKTLTPVILSVFEKNDAMLPPVLLDKESKNNLIKYIELSKLKDEDINTLIEEFVKTKVAVLVWGTGAQTLRLLENSNLNKINIVAFIDSNPKYQGKTLKGLPVISPEVLKTRVEPILISTRAYQNEIENQIKNELGLKNEVIKLF